MSTETIEANNSPAEAEAPAGGLAEEAHAPESEDTGSFDVEAWINEGAEQGSGEPSEAGEESEASAPELVDVEYEGQTHKIPAALKDAFLMRADYTRKTQELAQERQRATEEAAKAAERHAAESLAALRAEHTNIAVLEQNIEAVKQQMDTPDANGVALGKIDWLGFLNKVHQDPQLKPIYDEYRAKYDAARQTMGILEDNLKTAQADLKTKEDTRLQTQREQAQAALAKRQEETGKVLAQKVEGWSPEKAAEIATFAVRECGVQTAELAEMTDPRIWMLLHSAMQMRAENAQLQKTLKQHQQAATNAKAGENKPVAKVGGAAPNVRKTTDATGDGLSTAEWIRREQEREATKRAKR